PFAAAVHWMFGVGCWMFDVLSYGIHLILTGNVICPRKVPCTGKFVSHNVTRRMVAFCDVPLGEANWAITDGGRSGRFLPSTAMPGVLASSLTQMSWCDRVRRKRSRICSSDCGGTG